MNRCLRQGCPGSGYLVTTSSCSNIQEDSRHFFPETALSQQAYTRLLARLQTGL